MAEENTQDPPEPKPEDNKPEDKREDPKPEARRDEPRPDPEPLVKCPECRVRVAPEDLGSHRYLAHKVERRAGSKREDGDKDGDSPESPTPKRKQDSSGSNDKGAPAPGKRKSRWADVRSSW